MAAGDPSTAWGSASARAALAGNPSDGYGGAVLAVCLPQLAARVGLREAPAGETRIEPEACAPLVRVTLARHRDATRADPGPLEIRVETDIPREVGLAGSSAIVVATLRALDARRGAQLPRAELPALALAAEADVGIAAGLQDRVAQVHGGLTAMTFPAAGGFTATPLDPGLLPPLVLAWDTAGARPSGTYHADLRARWRSGEAAVRGAMERLGAVAHEAAAAVRRRDHDGLGAAMDESYELRASLGRLEPRHVALVERVRAAGFSVNYAGSGGAVIAWDRTGGAELPRLPAPLRAVRVTVPA